ncbi:MAG: M23 family metallopeptidase [Clostridia bacterium]|nr:M23 family metallopeptidase [Clostridia bacterium]
MIKKILVIARKSMKLTILFAISIFLIICAVVLFFKPIYSVSINGEQVGYTGDKIKLQNRINTYTEGEEDEENKNIAFVQIPTENLPEYKLCLLKRNVVTNDEEIFEKIKQSGVSYYKYYAILLEEEEKAYVSDFSAAEEIVAKLKEKNSDNIDKISILELYRPEMAELSDVEATVAALYVEKKVVEQPVNTNKKVANKKVSTSTNISYQKVPLGVNLIRPISGTITSRFGARSSRRVSNHTGLDIGAKTGTPIKAAASGTVKFSGSKGSFGYMIVISHGNGIETYYAHCSKLYAKAGERVNQGEVIAAVGNTGNSTGPHLHLEVRVNGVAHNPQNYVY